MPRVPFDELHDTLTRALISLDFTPQRAALCARLFAETTRDGVYTHGLNRFPRFVNTIRNGVVRVQEEPRLVTAFGALERWHGRRGPGNLNAYSSMARAIDIARTHGLGCVALAHTNHWMRAGTYGWQAAEAGMIGLCWTNTMPNLPPWGGRVRRLGNNPLVLAIPRPGGHIVLDMAMSQFSYGTLAAYRARGEVLPVDGGFDSEGRLTRDAAAIEASWRPLPIGYWKGSGLSMALDLMAALLSGGLATHQISDDPEQETSVSQVFLALHPAALGPAEELTRMADGVVESLRGGDAQEGGVRYPGERTLQLREENTRLGVPVDEDIWQRVRQMAGV
jgi:3-dehydro-L-gulonate 2-dehydrogenase